MMKRSIDVINCENSFNHNSKLITIKESELKRLYLLISEYENKIQKNEIEIRMAYELIKILKDQLKK